jgi:hypothetical protein
MIQLGLNLHWNTRISYINDKNVLYLYGFLLFILRMTRFFYNKENADKITIVTIIVITMSMLYV